MVDAPSGDVLSLSDVVLLLLCADVVLLCLSDAACALLIVAVYVAAVVVDDSGLSMKRSKLKTVWSLRAMLLLVLDLDALLSDVSVSHLFVVDVVPVVEDVEDGEVVVIDDFV